MTLHVPINRRSPVVDCNVIPKILYGLHQFLLLHLLQDGPIIICSCRQDIARQLVKGISSTMGKGTDRALEEKLLKDIVYDLSSYSIFLDR